MQEITTTQEFDTLLTSGTSFLIYKYNPDGCSLSFRTKPIVETAAATYMISAYWIDVQKSIKLKQYVAQSTGIEHASPQCILLRNGSVIADASLMHINREWFDKIVGKG